MTEKLTENKYVVSRCNARAVKLHHFRKWCEARKSLVINGPLKTSHFTRLHILCGEVVSRCGARAVKLHHARLHPEKCEVANSYSATTSETSHFTLLYTLKGYFGTPVKSVPITTGFRGVWILRRRVSQGSQNAETTSREIHESEVKL